MDWILGSRCFRIPGSAADFPATNLISIEPLGIIINRFRNFFFNCQCFIKKIHAQKYVDRTVTHIVLNVVKDERRLVI